MGFIKEFKEVRAHGNPMLHVIHTSDLDEVATINEKYEQHLKYQRHKIVGVDVEYSNEDADKQKAALVQLSIGKTQPVLLFQLSAANDKCPVFDNFLLDPRYTFVGVSINGDIEKLERVGLEITKFVDIQKEWRVPKATKALDSLGDVSIILIDDSHNDMKKKITDAEHKRWECMPLSMRHIEYVAKDTYTVYEIWSQITITQDGLRRAKMEKSRKRPRTWGDYY